MIRLLFLVFTLNLLIVGCTSDSNSANSNAASAVVEVDANVIASFEALGASIEKTMAQHAATLAEVKTMKNTFTGEKAERFDGLLQKLEMVGAELAAIKETQSAVQNPSADNAGEIMSVENVELLTKRLNEANQNVMTLSERLTQLK